MGVMSIIDMYRSVCNSYLTIIDSW